MGESTRADARAHACSRARRRFGRDVGAIALSSLLATEAAAGDPSGAQGAPATPPRGAPTGSGLESLTLEQLMAVPVGVAMPARPEPVQETPGIVTIVTREEIAASGARDLIDVLGFVPGFHFGVDVEGVVGPAFRGVWGQEGKILLLVDGQEFNELDYGTTQFGGEFPVDQIERIEIIRGPGSVVYGGFAELAVVHVITRSPDDFRGGAITATYGQMRRAFGRRSLSLFAAAPVTGAPGLDVSLGAFAGEGHRSDGTYTDFAGNSFEMPGTAKVDPLYLNAAVRYKGLALRFIASDYRVRTQDGFGTVLPRVADERFPAYFADARYSWAPSAELVVVPRFTFRQHTPWRVLDRESEIYANRHNRRYTVGLTGMYNPHPRVSLLAGAEGYIEHHELNDRELVGLQRLYSNGRAEVTYENIAALAQATIETPVGDFTGGTRFEAHSRVGRSFVPRVAYSKTIGWFHSKLQVAQAFRSPSVQNLALNPDISPERTTVLEVELGARIGGHLSITATGYDVMVDDPIVYGAAERDGDLVEMYDNLDRTGSRGVEAELRLAFSRVRATLGYSFYTSAGVNEVDAYAVPGETDLLLAFPAHKATLTSAVRLTDHLTVGPSAVLLSERFGVVGHDASGQAIARSHPASLLLNLYASYANAFVEGLEIGAGVFNILDQAVPFIQPYDGGHAPLPSPSREILARVSYSHGLP